MDRLNVCDRRFVLGGRLDTAAMTREEREKRDQLIVDQRLIDRRSYEDIAREHRICGERVRQIVERELQRLKQLNPGLL